MAKIMSAKYPGTCACGCEAAIREGAQISYEPGKRAILQACAAAGRTPTATVRPAVRAASRPTARSSYRAGRNWRPCGYPGCNPAHCDECDGEGYRPGH